MNLILLAFPALYLFESGFSNDDTLLPKIRSRLHMVKVGNLRLKLTTWQSNRSDHTESLNMISLWNI